MGNKKRLSLSEIQEHWVASLMIFFSVGVAILDFLGFLDSVPVIANRVPVLILLLLSTLTGYVAFVRTDADTKMHHDLLKRTAQINETIETIDSLKEIRVRSFKSFDECLNYANRQISQAKSKVYSVYWDAGLNFGQQLTNGIQHREIGMVHKAEIVLYKLSAPVIPSGVFGARNLSTRPVERFLLEDSSE
jgi:hypothetical protein